MLSQFCRECKGNYADCIENVWQSDALKSAFLSEILSLFALTIDQKRGILTRKTFLSQESIMSDEKLKALGQSHALHPHPYQVQDPLFTSGSPFFDSRDLVQVKYELLRRVRVDGDSVSHATSLFALSRPTFYAAQAAWERSGLLGLLQVLDTDKVIVLEQLALQDTEPNLKLIEPGGVRRQPIHVKRELTLHHHGLLVQPAFQLLGSVRGAIVENQADRPHSALDCLRNDDLLHKGLEIGKRFARATCTIDLSIGHTQPCKQMPGATTLIASLLPLGLAPLRRTRRLFPFTGLDRGFFIQTQQPRSLAEQAPRTCVHLQDRACPLDKAYRVMDMLPTVRAPGAQTLGFEPASDSAGRGNAPIERGGHLARHLSPTPTGQRHAGLTRQGAGRGGDLCAYFRGKNASVLRCEGRLSADGWPPSVPAICAPCDHWFRRRGQSVGYPSRDVHEPLTRFAHVLPGFGQCYGPAPGGAGLLPRYWSTRWDSLGWVLSSFIPPNPSLSRFPPFVKLGIDL